ncbi:aldo/keto reductase [Shouchella shacheensis]|uniref:aldo/keto reductase n=1 Tax=Shouchella shacheensis TaxID=1649580 RepID=UPI0007400D1D|nr:aldo/keto reductase [Shouchella shacheensis]
MEKRQLGNSDLNVSVLGLGGMSLGTDRQYAKIIIDQALDSGVNYIDTADLYDFGENESLIGEALKGKRDQIILATKAGNRFKKGKEGWEWDPSKAHIQGAVKDSLRRLKTDYIDLYQLHGGTIDDSIDETIEAFEELKQEGVIREYGISSIRPNVIRQYVEKSSIVSVMMQYSLLDRRPEEWFDYLQQHSVSVVARGSVAKGLISDRPLQTVPSAKDGYLNYTSNELNQFRDLLVGKYGKDHSLTEIAFQYDLHHAPVAAVVAGASKPEQMKQNIASVEADPLDLQEIDWLKRVTKADVYEQHRT